MQERLQLPIPMWRVQYQLLGGHRRTIAIAVVSAGLFAIGFEAFRRVMYPNNLSAYVRGALTLLVGVQSFLLLLSGANAVYRALVRDRDTKMIESHRLTPMSNLTVVLGYVFGATLQVTIMFLVTFLMGAVLTVIGGYPLGQWALGNIILFCAALPLWAFGVFVGLRPGKPLNLLLIVIILAMSAYPMLYVPGMGLLLGVYAAWTGIAVMALSTSGDPLMAAALCLVSILHAMFWVSASAARYRRPDLPAINAVRGYVLLVFWLLLSIGGMLAFHRSGLLSRLDQPEFDILALQWIVALSGGIVIACIVLASVMRSRSLAGRGTQMRGYWDRVPLLPVMAACLLAILIIPATLGHVLVAQRLAALPMGPAVTWALTGVCCLLALAMFRGIHAFFTSVLDSGGLLTWALIIMLWAMPPVIDSIRATALGDLYEPVGSSWILGCSPIGMLVALWYPVKIPFAGGLIVQVVAVVLVNLPIRRLVRFIPDALLK